VKTEEDVVDDEKKKREAESCDEESKTKLWSLSRKLLMLGEKGDCCRLPLLMKSEDWRGCRWWWKERGGEREREFKDFLCRCWWRGSCEPSISKIFSSEDYEFRVKHGWVMWIVELWTVKFGQLACGYWPGGNINCTITVQYMFFVQIVKSVSKSKFFAILSDFTRF